MVSFWPWKGTEDAASFERTLNALTGKINRAAARNDSQKQLARRARVMWTLYAGFAYILIAVVLTFVTGWQNWGPIEGSIVAGGPVLIYGLRYALMSYFDYRIRNTENYLKKLDQERDATIERLKEATKYNSTQQLLEKYGASPKPKEPIQEDESPARSRSRGPQQPVPPQGPRTGMAPPPTANIQRPQTPQVPQPPQQVPTIVAPPSPQPPFQNGPGAEFAPNAFDTNAPKQQQQQQQQQQPETAPATVPETHWYDRILDALLGEDETQAKNRFALICTQCRLVNGQAPPGARTLEDVGRWRCGGCSAWNGKEKPREDDITRLVQGWEAERRAKDKLRPQSTDRGIDSDNRETEDDGGVAAGGDESSGVDVAADSAEDMPPPSRSTRSKTRGRARK